MDWGVTLSRRWCDRMDRQGLHGSVGAAQTRAGLLPGTDAGQTGHSNIDRCVERSRARSHGQARSRYTTHTLWLSMAFLHPVCWSFQLEKIPAQHSGICSMSGRCAAWYRQANSWRSGLVLYFFVVAVFRFYAIVGVMETQLLWLGLFYLFLAYIITVVIV